MFGYQLLLNWAETTIPAGMSSLIASAAPLVSTAIAVLYFGERISIVRIFGGVIALVGIVLVCVAQPGTKTSGAIVIIIGAMLLYGAYHPLVRPLYRYYTGLEVATYCLIAAALMSVPLIPFAWNQLANADASTWVSGIYLGLLPSALAFVIWGYALSRLTIATSTSLLFLVPAIALLVSLIWLHEIPPVVEIGGGATVLLGVVLIGRGDRVGATLNRWITERRNRSHEVRIYTDAAEKLRFYRRNMTLNNTQSDDTIIASPGELGYTEATASFNTDAHLTPAFAVVARNAQDVQAVILVAAKRGLRVRAQSTGHAAKTSSDMSDELLIRTEFDAPVVIDPLNQTATIPAGTLWAAVVEAAAPYGLIAIHGSSPTVGAIGFLLRGGLSFYGRKFGVSSNSVRSITIVLATGETVTATEDHLPKLFWALRGGGGGFGVVTEIKVQLYPMAQIITGAVFWPAADATKIAPLWRRWTETAPNDATTNLRILNLPPLPGIPPALAAGPVLVMDGAISVDNGADPQISQQILDNLLNPLLAAADPIMNTWGRAEPATLPQTHMDPPVPVPGIGDHLLLSDLDDKTLLDVLALGALDATIAVTEIRQLGGRFEDPNTLGGAFDRQDARFLYFGGSAIFSEDARAGIDERLAEMRQAVDKWNSGYTAPTFVEDYAHPQRTLTPVLQARVELIRAEIDPTGMFAGDVAPVRDAVPAL